VVTSFVRDRGRAIGVAVALAVSMVLVSTQGAPGAVRGDPIASSTFKVKISQGFKNQLKHNGVKMKPKKLTLGSGEIDPTTGVGANLRLNKKIAFKLTGKGIKKCTRKADSKKQAKKCKTKVVYSNLKGSLPGNVKGSSGKLFKFGAAATVARNGFGADLSGIKVKFLKGAAKKINKQLQLHSLHPSSFGTASLSYQPKTVVVTGGTAVVNVPLTYLTTEANTNVTGKLASHCVDPLGGVSAIQPGVLRPTPPDDPSIAARFTFPVTGGTVGPTGTAGAIQLAGGVLLASGHVISSQPPTCAGESPGTSTSHSYLSFTNLAPNLGLNNVQANAFIGGSSPGCNLTGQTASCPTAVFGGDKGVAIGQVLDMSGASVSADPSAKTVTVKNALIRNNALSSLVLGGLFPNHSGNPAKDFVDGDKFGIATLNATTR
jgi:hypothetical protein